METKSCSGCKLLKPLSEFDRDKSRKCGYACACMACRRIRSARYRASVHQHRIDYGRAYRARKNAEDINLQRAKALRHHLWSKYRMTVDEYCEMLLAQEGKCASCGVVLTFDGKVRMDRLAVDHDHRKQKGDPGYVRGLLCTGCNKAAGELFDSVENALKLALYLEQHK